LYNATYYCPFFLAFCVGLALNLLVIVELCVFALE